MIINMEIDTKPVPFATATMLADALRGYVAERLDKDYLTDASEEAAARELRKRRMAFNILAVMEREPQAEQALVLLSSVYAPPPEIKINGVTIPDSYQPVLVEVINEELIQIETAKRLIPVEEKEKVVVENEKIKFLLALLKQIGVPVYGEYVAALVSV